jgi:hypothetical protein
MTSQERGDALAEVMTVVELTSGSSSRGPMFEHTKGAGIARALYGFWQLGQK